MTDPLPRMKITITGATGFVGSQLVAALQARGDDITVLSRDAERAKARLGGVDAAAWDWKEGPAPAAGLAGRDVVVHLAGEPVAQRWNDAVKREINDSRELGTRRLVAGLAAAEPRPRRLICSSAVAYYGDRGNEIVDEASPPGDDWLADVCVRWEREARAAEELGMTVATLRTGITLDTGMGVLASMLLPFKLGVGGPLAGGRQYVPWIHRDDLLGLYLAAIDAEDFAGAINCSAPEPVTNREFSRALGRALHRPAVVPVPGLAARLMVGEVGKYAAMGTRMVPGRAAELGYEFLHPVIDEALDDTLS
ncbi:MAG TPA: TIGR01777 family oxidoreductase [Solirubrobacteraceae bacterium]|nr:TIGR01777 family oxidoreductase [Solirubrobacteraceae bacterium]